MEVIFFPCESDFRRKHTQSEFSQGVHSEACLDEIHGVCISERKQEKNIERKITTVPIDFCPKKCTRINLEP
jgi:hypothetical protein